MGLIKAATETISRMLGDQWAEYYYCESMPANVLVTKGVKRVSDRSSNKKGADNIISNGSIIAVNEGQCMKIVEQGAIVEFCAEPGEFLWDASTEPSIFYGKLGENLKASWEILKRRFRFGGDTAKDQRIYFFNLKEIMDNKYGTPTPVPFRVVDRNIGLDVDISIRCNGLYSYTISDPMLFYKNVCGNVESDYTRDLLDAQLKSEFLTALQPAFARISAQGIRYSALPGHTMELAEAMNAALSAQWIQKRGIKVATVAVNSVSASAEDEAMIKELQIPEGINPKSYCFLVTLFDHFYWVSGTVLGALAGSLLPINYEGVDFALTALFVTIFVEQWLSTKNHGPAIVGVAATVICLFIFGADVFLIPSMVIIAASLILMRKTGKEASHA